MKLRLVYITFGESSSYYSNNNMGTQTMSTVGLSAGIYVIELESSDRLTKTINTISHEEDRTRKQAIKMKYAALTAIEPSHTES